MLLSRVLLSHNRYLKMSIKHFISTKNILNIDLNYKSNHLNGYIFEIILYQLQFRYQSIGQNYF